MGQIKKEFNESLRHLHRALYLCAIRLLSICGTLISRIALAVSRKPKSALFVFAITFFSVCMYQQGRVVVAEQGNMKAMKLKDDTINRLQSDVNFYKSMSNHPREVHDTIKIIKYKPIIKRDSI